MAEEVRCVHELLRGQCATCRAAKPARNGRPKKSAAEIRAKQAQRRVSQPKVAASPAAKSPRSLALLRDRMRELGQQVERLGRERNNAQRAGDLAKAAELAPRVKRIGQKFQVAQKEYKQAAKARTTTQTTRQGARKSSKPRKGQSTDGAIGLPDWSADVKFTADADAATNEVWITRYGNRFHNRDCQIIAGNERATKVSVESVRRRGLVRCMHCAPTVR